MIAEEIEFQISQYADGTLLAAERASVDDLLKADPAARQMLAEYRRLDNHLSRLGGSPAVRWERFAEHLSNAIDSTAIDLGAPEVAGRIGWTNSWSGRLRIAAAVLLAVTVGIVVNRGVRPSPVDPVSSPASVTDVTGPSAEVANGQSSEEVSVGPSRLASNDGSSPYVDSVVRGPSKVVIREAINSSKPSGKSQPH